MPSKHIEDYWWVVMILWFGPAVCGAFAYSNTDDERWLMGAVIWILFGWIPVTYSFLVISALNEEEDKHGSTS